MCVLPEEEEEEGGGGEEWEREDIVTSVECSSRGSMDRLSIPQNTSKILREVVPDVRTWICNYWGGVVCVAHASVHVWASAVGVWVQAFLLLLLLLFPIPVTPRFSLLLLLPPVFFSFFFFMSYKRFFHKTHTHTKNKICSLNQSLFLNKWVIFKATLMATTYTQEIV